MASVEIDRPVAVTPHRNRHPLLAWSSPAERDPDLIEAISETATIRAARDRAHTDRAMPDRMSGFLTGGSFVLDVTAWLVLVPVSTLPIALLLACCAAHVAASSIEFEIGPGIALPTTPVLFFSLFVLPPQLVPLVPFVGLTGAAIFARLRDPERRERFSVLAGSSWHAVGPALVFAALPARAIGVDLALVYVLALAAQFACDAAASWVRTCWGLGVPWRKLADALRFTFLADVTLAPIGVAAALAASHSIAGLLFLVGPIGLLLMLQRDRERHIDRAVVLSEAFTQSADRARRDVLTGLRNRLAWEEAIAHHTTRAGSVGVVLADVDGLKATNDALGHDAGDRLLQAIARMIADVSPSDGAATVARLGGDEFGVLLPGPLAGKSQKVAEALQRSLNGSTHTVDGQRMSASIGFGVARYGWDLATAFGKADRAVYDDKASRSLGRR
jgi:diguanylate cyclase (GGDEF)-like protein